MKTVKLASRSGQKTRQKKVTAIAVIIVLALAGIGAYYFTSSQTTYSGNRESIKIGVPPLESAALIYIAEDQNFHMKNIKKTGWDDYPHPSFNPFFTKYPA